VDFVGIVGRNRDSLRWTKEWIKRDNIIEYNLDTNDATKARVLMKEYDVGIIALPDRKSSYKTIETAIEARLSVVDILEEYHRRPDPYEREGLEVPEGMALEEYGESLHRRAIENDVALLDGMGFAPGLSNVTTGEGVRKVKADHAIARVGGIPNKESAARHPLKYMITWSFEHVLREYMVDVQVIEDGKIAEVKATSEREYFRFQECGKDEELECAVTPGMPSFLHTHRDLSSFREKTIRWPGHWQAIDDLKKCGLLDIEYVSFKGTSIRPRDFFLNLIEPKLRPMPGDKDVCVMWNTAWGKENRADYFLWSEADRMHGISAMAKVTGFSAAIGARLLVRGATGKNGIIAPEELIQGDIYQEFMEEMKLRDIIISERVSKSD
jgi:lysine 6-dehydrogenase